MTQRRGQSTPRSSTRLEATSSRQDGIEFLELAPKMGIIVQTATYTLEQANKALQDSKAGRLDGAAVLVPSKPVVGERLPTNENQDR